VRADEACTVEELARPAYREDQYLDGEPRQKRVRTGRKADSMNIGFFKTLGGGLLIGAILATGVGQMVGNLEGDPLRAMYAKKSEHYGPDMATLYDAQKKYCQPTLWRVMTGAHDPAICLYTDGKLRDYVAQVVNAQKYGYTVASIKSDSVHVQVEAETINEAGQEQMAQQVAEMSKKQAAQEAKPSTATAPTPTRKSRTTGSEPQHVSMAQESAQLPPVPGQEGDL
jgi:hypothetical protein